MENNNNNKNKKFIIKLLTMTGVSEKNRLEKAQDFCEIWSRKEKEVYIKVNVLYLKESLKCERLENENSIIRAVT